MLRSVNRSSTVGFSRMLVLERRRTSSLIRRSGNTFSPAATSSMASTKPPTAASFTRYPRKPIAMAFEMALGSSRAVRATSLASGQLSRRLRPAASPLLSGSPRSRSTTSGRCSTAYSIASRPLRRTATTSMPASDSAALIASANRSWSSTIKTRIGRGAIRPRKPALTAIEAASSLE